MEAHAHCILFGGMQLDEFARKHEGQYPYHPKGYANALLLMDKDCFSSLTGPGYGAEALREAKRTGSELSEAECGRVYVQGLTNNSNRQLALLFDKLPTPGGDHCHLPRRLWAPLGREVWTIGMDHLFVRESDWEDFASTQVDLLVQEGIERQEALRLFASKPK
jgi:hypothetical protein